MALIFGTLFKLINSRGNLNSSILLDEAPTVVIKGLDTLIATARSNEVAVVLGGQDNTQFVRGLADEKGCQKRQYLNPEFLLEKKFELLFHQMKFSSAKIANLPTWRTVKCEYIFNGAPSHCSRRG